MSIFERYAPFIQDFIYQNDWESLRAIQVAAGDAIFNTDENVLLSASTASGKTEAAFFPILTQFYEDPPTSVGAIYIGPLKALINDQFLRLNDLCAEAGIPVWHWHGDVSQSHKAKMLKHPSGILQITPESLEAMLLHKHAALTKLFHDLRYIVIDEVHSLMRGDRGGQTICLMERLCRMAGVNPRRIGLSATIGDLEATGTFLAAGTGRGTVIPRIESRGVRWRLSMEHFYVQDQQAAAEHPPEQALPELAPKTDTAPAHADPGIGYIFEHTRGKKCLVFVNSREECEAVTTTLRQYCEARHEPDRFLIHHGNLSSAYRETAETAMKDDDLFLTTVTTATLELGIYFPLGGSRVGKWKTMRNMLAVWAFTGLWHGASWNFVLWGLIFFVLLTLEKNVYGKFLERTHILKHAYIIFIIPLTWMVFAITDMHQLGTYFTRLFPFLTSDEVQSNTRDAVQAFHNYWKILVPCVLFSTPLPLMYYKKFRKSGFCMLLLLILFVLAIRAMMTQTNNPFLYFQF